MAFTFSNGEHHRNPSGCHNKVAWILSQCKWDSKTIEDWSSEFISNELLDRDSANPNHKGMRNRKWLYGWLDAIHIALWISDDKFMGRLPIYAFNKYRWLTQYKPMPIHFKKYEGIYERR